MKMKLSESKDVRSERKSKIKKVIEVIYTENGFVGEDLETGLLYPFSDDHLRWKEKDSLYYYSKGNFKYIVSMHKLMFTDNTKTRFCKYKVGTVIEVTIANGIII